MSTKKTQEPSMAQLGAELFALRRADGHGATVFLGAGASASSNVPSWNKLALKVCDEFSIECDRTNPLPSLYGYLHGAGGGTHQRRYLAFGETLGGHKHSLGYEHLAQLALEGYVSTIVTTNWDCLLESAFYRHIPAERLRFLIRGVASDKVIAGALAREHAQQVTIVKLHGDLASRVFYLRPEEVFQFEPELEEALSRKFDVPTYVVGFSLADLDVVRLLLARKGTGALYHVRFDPKEKSETAEMLAAAGAIEVSGKRKVVIRATEEVNIGSFDNFFTQLNLSVHLKQNEASKAQLKKLEESILAKEQRGLRYLNNAHIQELLDPFFKKIQRFNPNIVFFIDDPTAPGGLELKRRILKRLEKEGIYNEDISVAGAKNSRTFKRQVRSGRPASSKMDPDKILILDAITFSGNTLKIARKEVQKWFPKATVQCGVLVVSQQLLAGSKDQMDDDFGGKIEFAQETDRFEIFFPWGVTQTTSDLTRRFPTISGTREVQIVKRDWGAMELLAHDELCSTRLLVIEAGHKLSFQRHLCRDELYVALDDNIGLKIAGFLEDLQNVGEYDAQIQSLILERGDYVLIPRGVWHRPEASMDRARILEVAFGVYDQVNDIERIGDEYGRERRDGSR